MINGLTVFRLGQLTTELPNDPEDTMQLAVTKREAGLLFFGLHFVHSLFPELKKDTEGLCAKINEVGTAQDFLIGLEDE